MYVNILVFLGSVPVMSEDSKMKSDSPSGEDSLENKLGMQQVDANDKGSRYAKTFQVFQQMGLLEHALQMAKLCKENEQLQQKINKLEAEVNESSQKARQDLKEKLEQTEKDLPTE